MTLLWLCVRRVAVRGTQVTSESAGPRLLKALPIDIGRLRCRHRLDVTFGI